MQTAPGTTPSATRYASPTPVSRHATADTAPQDSTDVAMESVSSRSSSRSKRDQDEGPDDLFDLDARLTGTAATVSTATAGAGVARVRLSTFSELKEFNEKYVSEKKACAWFNRLKSASRRNGMTGDELTNQFGIQYCGKGVSMASRYSHVSKHKREHVELFINTLGAQEQELTSCLTLMEVQGTVTLEEEASLQIAADDYDSGHEGDSDDHQICDQDRDGEERAKLFVMGHAPQLENARRDFETGGATCAGQHPTDRCLRACKACGDVHEAGKCSLETFFNQLRQWYDPQNHAGMLPPTAEKMDKTYFTVEKTRVKVTLAGNMMYYMDLWVGTSNIGEKSTVLDAHTTIGWWTPIDAVPRAFGFVQPGSRKYDEWQNLAYGATSDVNDEAIFQETSGSMTERRFYSDPQAIMGRSEKPGNPQGEHQGRKVAAISTVSREDIIAFTDAVKTPDAFSPKLEHGPHLRMGSTEEPDPSFKEISE
ncbi:Eukaryotic/viral aspartic protease [Phytophthora megakarya]|uniref:Eukaryotic/viral aspartic protease n=1 Tax=Phytophthora megakarya TaxID=4795 RepID=A0A225V534_9STRA|nr:Eukaryotic/viral aspartic protease [Phytophthora megakarya]